MYVYLPYEVKVEVSTPPHINPPVPSGSLKTFLEVFKVRDPALGRRHSGGLWGLGVFMVFKVFRVFSDLKHWFP